MSLFFAVLLCVLAKYIKTEYEFSTSVAILYLKLNRDQSSPNTADNGTLRRDEEWH